MRLFTAFAVALLAASSLDAQMVTIPLGGPKRVRPSPNATLLGSPASVAAAVAVRSRPTAMTDLDETRHPVEVLGFLGLPLAARVLDVMAGEGYYSEIIGAAIGSTGRVTALVLPAVMADPAKRIAISGVIGRAPNVSILAVSPATVQFAPNVFDFVLMHLVYHELYSTSPTGHGRIEPADFLRKIYLGLRPGGIVGVVDHAASPGGDTSAVAGQLHRINPATVKADFLRTGFVLDGESKLLAEPDDDHSVSALDPAIRGETDRFVLRFRKPE